MVFMASGGGSNKIITQSRGIRGSPGFQCEDESFFHPTLQSVAQHSSCGPSPLKIGHKYGMKSCVFRGTKCTPTVLKVKSA